jgi:hypothetical protein
MLPSSVNACRLGKMKSESAGVPPLFPLFLAGLTALGFLALVWQRREMPVILRGLLIIVAVAVVVVVGWTLTAALRH